MKRGDERMVGQVAHRTFQSRSQDRLEVIDSGTRTHLKLIAYLPAAQSGDPGPVAFEAEVLPPEQASAACSLLRWALDQEDLSVPLLVPIGAMLGREPPRVVLHARVCKGEMSVRAEKDIFGAPPPSAPFDRLQADALLECLGQLAAK
jgi:hypothetical protein